MVTRTTLDLSSPFASTVEATRLRSILSSPFNSRKPVKWSKNTLLLPYLRVSTFHPNPPSSQIVTELEEHHNNPHLQRLITESTLLALQTLLDYTINKDDPIEIENLSDELSAKNLSLSTALHPLIGAMDSGEPHHSLLASKVYLSLLLTKNFPVISLFNPVAFHSLLRTIRLSFKNCQSVV
ncbi:hypothetical protein R6Q57_019650 [Mikania cordata]